MDRGQKGSKQIAGLLLFCTGEEREGDAYTIAGVRVWTAPAGIMV